MEVSQWLVYGMLVVLTVALMLGCSFVLGQKHRDVSRDCPYESGMNPTGSARVRFPVNFYMVALLFIVFDVAAVFVVAWAIAAKTLGWTGLGYVAIFMGIMSSAVLYFWRQGALDLLPGKSQETFSKTDSPDCLATPERGRK